MANRITTKIATSVMLIMSQAKFASQNTHGLAPLTNWMCFDLLTRSWTKRISPCSIEWCNSAYRHNKNSKACLKETKCKNSQEGNIEASRPRAGCTQVIGHSFRKRKVGCKNLTVITSENYQVWDCQESYTSGATRVWAAALDNMFKEIAVMWYGCILYQANPEYRR